MAPSRGIEKLLSSRWTDFICGQCRSRGFATTRIASSGHNRWSKIKHDKGKNDALKNRQRSAFSQEIATVSKLYGPDPNSNAKLYDLITKAKREGFAKAGIESAIARGQGRSSSGAALEAVVIEGMLPGGVALIIDCETDNRARTMMDVRHVLKEAGGKEGPCSYLFEKRGRILFEQRHGVGAEEALDAALEAGATDVEEDEEGAVTVFCEPAHTKAVGEIVSDTLKLGVRTNDIVWVPNPDTTVELSSEHTAEELSSFIDELIEKDSSVQAISMNAAQGSATEGSWKELVDRLNS